MSGDLSADRNDGLAVEVRHLHPAGLVAAEDLGSLAAHAFQNAGVVTAAVANDDDIAGLRLTDWHGITEGCPGLRKSIGFGRLPAGLAGDRMQEKAAPWGAAGICAKNVLEALVVLGLMQPGVFFCLV